MAGYGSGSGTLHPPFNHPTTQQWRSLFFFFFIQIRLAHCVSWQETSACCCSLPFFPVPFPSLFQFYFQMFFKASACAPRGETKGSGGGHIREKKRVGKRRHRRCSPIGLLFIWIGSVGGGCVQFFHSLDSYRPILFTRTVTWIDAWLNLLDLLLFSSNGMQHFFFLVDYCYYMIFI